MLSPRLHSSRCLAAIMSIVFLPTAAAVFTSVSLEFDFFFLPTWFHLSWMLANVWPRGCDDLPGYFVMNAALWLDDTRYSRIGMSAASSIRRPWEEQFFSPIDLVPIDFFCLMCPGPASERLWWQHSTRLCLSWIRAPTAEDWAASVLFSAVEPTRLIPAFTLNDIKKCVAFFLLLPGESLAVVQSS